MNRMTLFGRRRFFSEEKEEESKSHELEIAIPADAAQIGSIENILVSMI